MNTEAQQYLDTLVQKEPHQLNDMQAAFLKARSSYLTEEQREKFSQFLGAEISEKLKEQAKAAGVKGIHLYKSADKLQEAIKKVTPNP